MRSFVSLASLALALFLPGCLAAPDDEVGLSEGALTDNGGGPSEDTRCHIDEPGGTTGGVVDGTRDGIWCCGMAECTDPATCGDDLGHFVETCGNCEHYECDPGSGLGPDEHGGGGSSTPGVSLADILDFSSLEVELPRSVIRIEHGDFGTLSTVDRAIERDRLGAIDLRDDGARCAAPGSGVTSGTMYRGECCARVTCDDRLTCGRSYGRASLVCASCDDDVCMTSAPLRMR
jgi:hypothetical protein